MNVVKVDFNDLLAAAYFPTILISIVIVVLFVPWSISLWQEKSASNRPRRHLVSGIAIVWSGQMINAIAQFTYFVQLGNHPVAAFQWSTPFMDILAGTIVTARMLLLIGAMFLISGYVTGKLGRDSPIVWPILTAVILLVYIVATVLLWPIFS